MYRTSALHSTLSRTGLLHVVLLLGVCLEVGGHVLPLGTHRPEHGGVRGDEGADLRCRQRAVAVDVRRVEELIGCPVSMVSTSPEREDVILMRDPFKPV